jgi:heme/copper-type cytochrome/quinol oxidase subunit 2
MLAMIRKSRLKLLGAGATLAALAAILILFVFGDSGSGAEPLKIEVFAKQYSWSFGYPAQGNAFSKKEVHVPVGEPIEFEMHSQDVIHAFWVPEWKIKVDTPPAQIATASVTPEKTGTFQVICSEQCGIAHFAMHAKLVVEPADRFQRWVAQQGAIPKHWRELATLDRELESIHESAAG